MASPSESIMELFSSSSHTGGVVRVCAPMVRYSKLPFRKLVRKYGTHIAYTPMIVSESFVRSQKARDVEFTTDSTDCPLIIQFAAGNIEDFSLASQIATPFVNGIDLNCGCPQRWALQEGVGAALISNPQLIVDMIRGAQRHTHLPISIKIRIHNDIKETVELCRRAQYAGVSWITVHGRTIQQRAEPVNLNAIKTIKDSLHIPVIANGDVRTERDIAHTVSYTGVNGVMAARGILQNPAMYDRAYSDELVPLQCVQDWVDISLKCGVTFSNFHHHLMYMLERVLAKTERRVFNTLTSTPAVLEYLKHNYGITYNNLK